VPDTAVVPLWYNPAITRFTATPNLVHIPVLGGHLGVGGLVGNGTPQQAALNLKVDNDPHFNWIKVFWFQFDRFGSATGDLTTSIAKLNYDRAIVHEKVEPIGQGWERVTIQAQLIPQPDDEDIDWTFVENAFGSVAIDDLFVSSKCVKPNPDEDGDAQGQVVAPPINLTIATGGRECLAVAATRAPTPTPQPIYWVAARAPNAAASHSIFQMNNTGVVIGAANNLPSTALAAPLGPTDLAVETVFNAAAQVVQEWVYAIVDERQVPGGDVVVYRLDASGGTPVIQIPLLAFPALAAGQSLGLAYDPSGNLGQGTFWVTADTPAGTRAFEFTKNGVQLLDSFDAPDQTTGIAYDDTLGNFYCFSREPMPTPTTPVQVNGYEISAYDYQPTGNRFCGDLTIANAGGPRGGLAAGLELYRTFGGPNSEIRFVCVAEVGMQQFLYEVAGPFSYGKSRFGRCRMRNGPPFVGGAFEVTLSGVPNSALAILFLGFGDAIVPLFQEGVASILPSVASAALAPVATGEFALPIALPNNASLGYQPVFFQWVVLDSTAPGLIGLTQAGKTVLYP
jgi:hypothetical protein